MIAAGIFTARGQAHPSSIALRVSFVPGIVTIKGAPTTYYELHIINFTNDSIALKALQVVDNNDLSVIALFDKEALQSRVTKRVLMPGDSGIVYLEYHLPGNRKNVNVFH